MSEQTDKSGKKAVVIGANMAGLLAARALAEHFEQVALLERDTFPAPGLNRKGVPQGKHIHVLLELGREIMEEFLPGLTDELTSLGAVTIADASSDLRWFHSGGYLGDHAPTDYQGFVESARQLPAPDIYNVIKDAELLSGPVPYKFPANLRRHYEKLSAFPEGYLVIGDALCSFNPIYGQGMTVAAREAVALGQCLTQGRSRLAQRFFARANKIIDLAWSAAVGTDLGFPGVEGPRTPMVRFFNWYIGKLHVAAHQDAQVSIAFLKVINMIAPPPSILHPRIIWRVAKAHLWPGRQKASLSRERIFELGHLGER
jgi:2-polyprenyl-6-methoxyphenol hydroxylase-like FAD-dependent oxidoreductase